LQSVSQARQKQSKELKNSGGAFGGLATVKTSTPSRQI
jgi:hypothetical protein